MDLPLTLAIAVAVLGVVLFAGWRGSRPPNPHRGPRLMPWRFIMVTGAACLLPLLIHLATLLGLRADR